MITTSNLPIWFVFRIYLMRQNAVASLTELWLTYGTEPLRLSIHFAFAPLL